MSLSAIRARFWGVRGSIPAPLTPAQVEAKILDAVAESRDITFKDNAECREWLALMPFHARSTYGGNTTCVEVRCGGHLFVLDLGTGVRALGGALVPEMMKERGVRGTILQTHVHWDHIQGFPFFFPARAGQLEGVTNRFDFYGGTDWQSNLEQVLRGQQNPPVFPVDFRELQAIGAEMLFNGVHDGWSRVFGDGGVIDHDMAPNPHNQIRVQCRKLNHPQETYGYRIEYRGEALVFTTDHEPFAGGLHRPLVDLVRGADAWITDCQYSHDEYVGAGGRVQKMGWGHSYPEYIADVAREAKPALVVTTHHDPASSDERVASLAADVERLSGIPTVAAHEGLVLP